MTGENITSKPAPLCLNNTEHDFNVYDMCIKCFRDRYEIHLDNYTVNLSQVTEAPPALNL